MVGGGGLEMLIWGIWLGAIFVVSVWGRCLVFSCAFVEMGHWVGMGASVGHLLLVGQPSWSHPVRLGEVQYLVILDLFFFDNAR